MHDTALENGIKFFDLYLKNSNNLIIVDIGSQDVNGSLRGFCPSNSKYIGLVFAEGKGVDIVLEDPYSLPFNDNSVDVVVSSSCFEHSEFFWLTFNEILRILKPKGLLYINVPAAGGEFHRFPVDCWRFYPDSGIALQNWGKRNGFKCALLESFVGYKKTDNWNDFVAIFVKEKKYASHYKKRILDKLNNFSNGMVFNSKSYTHYNKNIERSSGWFTLVRIIKSTQNYLVNLTTIK